MKKINSTGLGIVKDFIISILIVACLVLVFSIFFYDKISISKVVPVPEEYVLKNDMQEELNESISEEEKETVTTYSISASELKKYETTKVYNKGKKHPFAAESEATSNEIVNGNSNVIYDTPLTNTFYGDQGTK